MDLSRYLPARSTVAGGLVPIAGWILYLIFPQVPMAVWAGVVTFLVPVVVHIVPDSVKTIAVQLNTTVEELSKVLPVVEAPQSPTTSAR